MRTKLEIKRNMCKEMNLATKTYFAVTVGGYANPTLVVSVIRGAIQQEKSCQKLQWYLSTSKLSPRKKSAGCYPSVTTCIGSAVIRVNNDESEIKWGIRQACPVS